MLSAIVYGRNDGYSYELNRRTALGLNQLAEQMAPGRDQIVFVDYNTDNDLPTHPEAIADTLTPRAQGLIRVIRVRPDLHASLTTPGPPVREAICRNIALRRLAPETRWVLSTNPDCMLISADGPPLSDLIAALAEGYYALPRFELPRFIWESLPRSLPRDAAAQALSVAAALNTEEIVRHYLPAIGYDAPGDFQLAPRAALVAMAGFDERMSQGWHVDSNLNARLALTYGAARDLNDETGGGLKLFHAEHARRFSAKHGAGRAEDRFDDYVANVTSAIPPGQAESWGAAGAEFEEFPLTDPPARRLIRALTAAPAPGAAVGDITYGPDSFNALPRDENHLAGFLIDHLAYAPPGDRVGWFGDDAAGFNALMRRAGAPQPVIACTDIADVDDAVAASDILIIDAPRSGDDLGVAHHAFAAIILSERQRAATGRPPRRIIGVNAPHSLFEAPFLTFVHGAMTPVTTRIRYGEVTPRDWTRFDLMNIITAGEAGALTDHGVEARQDCEGYMALCRFTHLPPGPYRVEFEVELGANWAGRLVADIALNGREAAATVLQGKTPGLRSGGLTFTSGADGLFAGGFEFRLFANGKVKARLKSAVLIAEDA